MEPDPPSATGISPSVAQRVMQQRPDDQRSRVRRLARPHHRPASTSRQGQPTSILARRMREPTPAGDNLRHEAGRNPRARDIAHAAFHHRGCATRVKRFRRSDRGEPMVMHAWRWNSHGGACAGSTLAFGGYTPYAGYVTREYALRGFHRGGPSTLGIRLARVSLNRSYHAATAY
jgi:hypothetical protein